MMHGRNNIKDEKYLLRGTNSVSKYSSLRFVFKGLVSEVTMQCVSRVVDSPIGYDFLAHCD
jgi:hypothetical protein